MQQFLRNRTFSVLAITSGTLAYSFGQWLVLIMLARQASKEDVGFFSLALAICAPISLLMGLSLRTVFLTDMHDKRYFGDFLFLRIAGSVLTIVLSLAYAIITGVYSAIFVSVVLCKAIDLVTDIFCAPLQEKNQLWRVGLQSGLNGSIGAATVALCLYTLKTSPEIAILSRIAGSVVALISTAIHNPDFPVTPRLNKIRPILRIAWPMGISAMVVSLLPNIPRYILNSYVSIESVGVFSAVAYLTIIGTTVVSAVAQLFLPRLVKLYHAQGRAALHRMVTNLVTIMGSIGVLATILSTFLAEPLLEFFYGKDYNDQTTFIVLMAAWALGAVGWMYDLGLSTKRLFRAQLASSAIAVVFVLISSLLMIPMWHTLGAAYATLVGAIVQLISRIAFFTHETWPTKEEFSSKDSKESTEPSGHTQQTDAKPYKQNMEEGAS